MSYRTASVVPGAFLLLVLVLLSSNVRASEVVFGENFQEGLRPIWQTVEFKGTTTYHVVKQGTNAFLQADARSSASGLAVKLGTVASERASLAWRWKIDRVPPGGSEKDIKTFDHAARLFVAFKTFLGPPRTINYVWANQQPVGATFHHPNSGRARFIVLQSGNARAGQWIVEQRDLARDWKLLFGDDEPPPITGLGLMTDSDGTKSDVAGGYDDIRLQIR